MNNDHMFEDEENMSYTMGSETHGSQGENPYQKNDNQQNPYQNNGGYNNNQQNPYTKYAKKTVGPHGKKLGLGFGIASLVLGLMSLFGFFTIINIIPAILAIIFGIIQIASYEKKGFAIGGIVTAVASIALCLITWGLILTNASFLYMMQDEMLDILENDEDFQEYMDQYLDDNGVYIYEEDDTL